MYHLLSHLADPSDWEADASDSLADAPPAHLRTLATIPSTSRLSTQESGSFFRAPAPRLHVSR